MPDQAQGLRALADKARRDQSGHSLTADVDGPSTGPVAADTPLLARANVSSTHAISPIDTTFSSASAYDRAVIPDDARRSGLDRGSQQVDRVQRARVVAVTSGKGGVGKTNFSCNLSLAFAAAGKQVIIVDADLGLANVHVVLGVTPRYSLDDVMRGEQTLEAALCPGPNGIQILGGASGIAELANLDEKRRSAFIQGLRRLDSLADVIVIDTGAGLSRNVLAFLCAVEEVIVVTTPEPTAITDAYAMIKVVARQNPTAQLMLVSNMVQNEGEGHKVADRLISIADRFLHVNIEYLGYLPQDYAVARSVRAQQPFMTAQPASEAAQAVRHIAARLLNEQAASLPSPGVGALLNRVQQFFGFKPSLLSSVGER